MDETITKDDEQSKVIYSLNADMELRFEVKKVSNEASIMLDSGMAEIFGTELILSKKYALPAGSKMAVFTYHGCVLALTGEMEFVYSASETPNHLYANIHCALEQMRRKSDTEMGRGPRIMVVGPTDVGKSSLCKILNNYAVRCSRKVIYVDVDVGQNDIAIPGTIGALLIHDTTDIEEGYVLNAPFVYHFGHVTPADNIKLYNHLVTRLTDTVNMRTEANYQSNIGGVIINTCGWVRGGGYQCLLHVANSFQVDVVIVMDQDLLYNQLKKDLLTNVKVILVPKSGGVVERSTKIRTDYRNNQVRNYFYGVKKNLYPHSINVRFEDIKIFKIGAQKLPDSLLPLGMIQQDNQLKPIPVKLSNALKYHVCSASMATTEDDIINQNVAGFVVITKVDIGNGVLQLLSPEPPPFQWNILLLMDNITFLEN